MEWMEIEEGKLKHHIVMECGEKPLHMVAQGEHHYGEWLMTAEEREAYKKWDDMWENVSEWNKFSDHAIWKCEKAYEAGLAATEHDPDFGTKEYPRPSIKRLADRHQDYYNFGFNKTPKDKIEHQKILVSRCPWHAEETCKHYREHPWVDFDEAMCTKDVRPMNAKRAIKERGSPEKMQEFVAWYNAEKGKIEKA